MRAGHIPLKNKPLLALLLLSCLVVRAQEKPRKAANGTRSPFFDNHPFLWGAASAAYQVEGAYKADGKGLSIWDVWMNRDTIAGKNVTGNVAINFYNRNQYLKDIALFKKQGLTSYRFSVSWPRLIPDGTGAVNPVAVQHYRTFINDLKAAGIEPIMTLYHWDMPAALYQKGGWDNRESVEWFANYANVIFDNFKDQVKVYVLINEMFIETILDFQAEDLAAHRPGAMSLIPEGKKLERALTQFNHKLLAAAAAARLFKTYRIPQAEVGMAFPLFPSIAVGPQSAGAASFVDGIVNRWFLDAIYKGAYPADILDYANRQGFDLHIQPDDARMIQQAGFGYLGINYYAPLPIQQDSSRQTGFTIPLLPNTDYAYNGPNRPDQFERLLLRIRDEYGNPPVIITENGAGFPDDDKLVGGVVNDKRRSDYVRTHLAAMQSAIDKGANVRGYHIWSSHDNLEWTSGYGRRFGMIYVDFATQQRTPKQSYTDYAQHIRQAKARSVKPGR